MTFCTVLLGKSFYADVSEAEADILNQQAQRLLGIPSDNVWSRREMMEWAEKNEAGKND